MIGIWLIGSALEGYIVGFGRLGEGIVAGIARALLLAAGLAMALPGGGELELSHLQLSIAGLGLAGAALVLASVARRFTAARS